MLCKSSKKSSAKTWIHFKSSECQHEWWHSGKSVGDCFLSTVFHTPTKITLCFFW